MNINNFFSGKIHTWVLVLVVSIFNLVLQNIPLTNVLGYEFSVSNSILLGLLGGIFFINRGKRYHETSISFCDIFGDNFLIFSSFITIPIVISLGYTFLFGICPISETALFYLALTFPTFFIGTVIGYFCLRIFKRFVYVIFSLIYLVILLLPLIEIYYNPQVYFYGAILGYFPGNIYDEDLVVDKTLLLYRLFNLVYFGGIIFFLNRFIRLSKVMRITFLTAIVVFAAAFSLLKPALGFASNHDTIKNELTGELKTNHFNIIYTHSLSKKEIENFAQHAEYFFNSLSDELGVSPSEPVTAYIFENNKQKRRLFGAGNADVAKPWLNSIYTTYDNYESTLHHELAHVFAAQFGTTPFKVADNINPLLIEGFAMMMEDDYAGNDIHYMASLAYKSNYKFPLEELFKGLMFFTRTSSLSYIYSGSFLKYLKNEYGIKSVINFYGDIDFKKYFATDFAQLEENYYNFLEKLNYEINLNEADLYFGRKPIFKRTCPRYVAVRVSEGWSLYNKNKYADARELFLNVFEYSENYSAMVGYINCMIKTGESNLALKLLSDEIGKYKNTSYYFNLEMILAGLYVRNEKYEEAKVIYEELIQQKPSVRYFISAENRLYMLNYSEQILANYLNGSDFDKYEIMDDLYEKTSKIEFIPALVTLSKRLNQNYNNFIQKFSDLKFSANQVSSSYAAFRLAGFAVENMDYDNANRFMNLADDFILPQKENIYTKYKHKIDWLLENNEKVKTGFEYIN